MKPGKSNWVVWVCLALPVAWFLWVLAAAWQPDTNLDGLLTGLQQYIAAPFSVPWTSKTGPLLLVGLGVYAMAVYYYEIEQHKKRPGEEYGSAKWGNVKQLNAKYADRQHPEHNIILTQNLRLGMDSRKHRRNLNVLVVGGSGSGTKCAVPIETGV